MSDPVTRTAALSALAEEDAALLGPDLPADVMLDAIAHVYDEDDMEGPHDEIVS
jgi:hypothetical protein